MFRKKASAFGLDISNRSMRLIQLEKNGRKNYVKFYNETKLPPNCLNDGEIIQPEIFLDALKKLIKTKKGRGKISQEVIVTLPENKTYLKIIELELSSDQDIEQEIKNILPRDLPIDINDFYFDWQKITTDQSNSSYLVGASPKTIVDSYVKVISQANLMPVAMEIEAAAISRTLIDSANSTQPTMVIDIGANRTGLFIYFDQTIAFTVTLPISGNQITDLISNTLELDRQQAEQAKIICGLDPTKCSGALLEIFSDTIEELGSQINKAIYHFNQKYSQKKIEKIILCGGGANFINIGPLLQEKLNITVEISNPWQNIINPNEKYFTQQSSQSYITALGLALRGMDSKFLTY